MKSWGLDSKVIFLLSLFILVGGSSTYLGIYRIGVVKESMDHIVQNNVTILQKTQELKSLYNMQLINEKNFILEKNQDELASHKKNMSDKDQHIQKVIKDIESVEIDGETAADLEQFKKYGLEWLMLMDQIESHKRLGETDRAVEITQVQGRDLQLKVTALLDQIIERNLAMMNGQVKETNELYNSSRNLMSSISIFGFLIGLVIAAVVFLSTKKILRSALQKLTMSTQEVKSNSGQLKDTSVEISSATAQQASSIQETASAIEELTSMVKKNADNAQDASHLAGKSSESAEKGRIVVQDMIKAINDISSSNDKMVESINHSNEQISNIVKVIAEIGGKTKIINDIVFQTKLLAFNASVEAARAGEHGKGFAVVAEEVGNLAEMSGKASAEISSLLENSINKVQSIVDETNSSITSLVKESNSKVDAGTEVANECGRVLGEIVGNVQKVSSMANEISSASQEQSLGVQEITKAMNTLDEATQSNASTAEQSSATAVALNLQANNLQGIFNIFVKALEGSKSDLLIKEASNPSEAVEYSQEEFVTTHQESISDNVLPMSNSLLDKSVEKPEVSFKTQKHHREDIQEAEEVQWVSLDEDGHDSLEEENDFKVI